MKKNVASQVVGAQMVTAADGTAFTGSVTAIVTGDGGTQGGGGACTHEGNGFHTYLPTQAETNFDHVAFTFTGSGAIPCTVQIYTSFPQTGDSFARLGAPAGASIAADLVVIDNFVDDIESRLGTPSDLGSGATVAANLVDIESQTDDIGAAGAGLTALATAAELAKVPKSDGAVSWNATALAAIQSEVHDEIVLNKLDVLLANSIPATFDETVADDSVLGFIVEGASGTGTINGFDRDAHSLEAIGDRVLSNESGISDVASDVGNILATTDKLDAMIESDTGTGGDWQFNVLAVDRVWDATLTRHLTTGTTGAALNAAGSAGDPWATSLPGAYGDGTAGFVVGNLRDLIEETGTGSLFRFTASALDHAANIVWDELRAGHVITGSFGQFVPANVTHYGGTAGTFASGIPTANLNTSQSTSGIFADDTVGNMILGLEKLAGNVSGSGLVGVYSIEAGVITSTVAPALAFLDSSVSTLRIILDRLDGMLQESGTGTGLYQFTTDALENGPSRSVDLTPVTSLIMTNRVFLERLDSMLQESGTGTGLYQYTTDALENGPGGSGLTVGGIADAVWDEIISGHLTAGSAGALLNTAGAAADPLLNAVPGAYAAGTAGAALGKIGTGRVSYSGPVAAGGAASIVKGDTYSVANGRSLSWTDTDAGWPTLTDAVITFESDDGALEVTGEVVTATGSNKQVRVNMTATESATLHAGSYDFAVVATFPGSDSLGRVTLVRDVLTVLDTESA